MILLKYLKSVIYNTASDLGFPSRCWPASSRCSRPPPRARPSCWPVAGRAPGNADVGGAAKYRRGSAGPARLGRGQSLSRRRDKPLLPPAGGLSGHFGSGVLTEVMASGEREMSWD